MGRVARQPDLPAARGAAAARRRARQATRAGAPLLPPQSAAARHAAPARIPPRPARAAPARHAAGEPEGGAARARDRQGRTAAADGREPLLARRRRRRAREGRATRTEQFAPAQFRDLDDADKLSPPAVRADAGRHRARRAGPAVRLGARGRARRPLRARSSSTRTTAASSGASAGSRRALRSLPRRQRGRALGALSSRGKGERVPFGDGSRCAARRSSSPRRPTTSRVATPFSSEAAARDDLAGRIAADPPARERAARDPGVRGALPHDRDARDVHVPAVAAPGAREPASPRPPRGRAVRASRSTLQLDADRARGRRSSPPPVSRAIELYGPGDIDRRRPARDRAHRAARLDHELRAELPRRDRVLRRGLPLALHARRAGRRDRAAAPWLALVVLDARTSSPTATDRRAGPLPAIAVADRGRAARAATSSGRGRTCTSTVRSCRRAPRRSSTDMAAVLPQLAGDARREPRPRLLAARVPAPARAEHRLPRVPRARVRDRPAGRARARPGRRADPAARRPGRRTRGQAERGCCPYYYRWYFRTGAVGDFEYLVRLLQAAPGRPARRRARHRRAASRARTCRRSTTRRCTACSRSAARCGCRSTRSTEDEQAERQRDEHWAQPVPAPVPARAGRPRQPRRRLRRADRGRRERASNLGPGVAGRPGPARRAAALRALARADVAAARRARRHRARPDDNWVHELNLDPRHRVGGRLRHARRSRRPGGRTCRPPGSRSATCSRRTAAACGAARARARGRVAHARTWRRSSRRAPGRSLGDSPRRVLSRVRDRRVSPCRHAIGRERSARPPRLAAATRRAMRPARPARTRGAASPSPRLRRHGLVAARQRAARSPPRRRRHAARRAPHPSTTSPRPPAARAFLRGSPICCATAPWLRFVAARAGRRRDRARVVLCSAGLARADRRRDRRRGAARRGAVARATRLVQTSARRTRCARTDSDARRGRRAARRAPTSAIAEPGSRRRPRHGRDRQRRGDALQGRLARRRAPAARTRAAAAPRRSRGAARRRRARASACRRASIPTAPCRCVRGRHRRPRPARQRPRRPRLRRGDGLSGDRHADVPAAGDRSTELFLPNLNLIEPNSITLLETNQRFIEAYMVGLNHEFARELLWREYPTDQRGSYSASSGTSRASSARRATRPMRERAARHPADPPLGAATPKLGDHDNRERAGPDTRTSSCSCIRGELLKKYPNAVIYAQRARVGAQGRRRDRPVAGARRSPTFRRDAAAAARHGQDAAVRGEGRPGHLLLRLRPDRERGAAAAPASTGRRPGLVLRDQGTPRRAALRLRRRRATVRSRSGTTSRGPDVLPTGDVVSAGGGAPTFNLEPPGAAERPGEGRPARRGRARDTGARP